MAYLLQLYRQENSLKCSLRNKLLIDDIHITITEGRGCVAEGKAKKKRSQRQKRQRCLYYMGSKYTSQRGLFRWMLFVHKMVTILLPQ